MLDCGMIWHFLAGPALTFVLFVGGLYIWRRQLIAKRRFEVAEQAIAASIGAIEGSRTSDNECFGQANSRP